MLRVTFIYTQKHDKHPLYGYCEYHDGERTLLCTFEAREECPAFDPQLPLETRDLPSVLPEMRRIWATRDLPWIAGVAEPEKEERVRQEEKCIWCAASVELPPTADITDTRLREAAMRHIERCCLYGLPVDIAHVPRVLSERVTFVRHDDGFRCHTPWQWQQLFKTPSLPELDLDHIKNIDYDPWCFTRSGERWLWYCTEHNLRYDVYALSPDREKRARDYLASKTAMEDLESWHSKEAYRKYAAQEQEHHAQRTDGEDVADALLSAIQVFAIPQQRYLVSVKTVPEIVNYETCYVRDVYEEVTDMPQLIENVLPINAC